MGYLRDHWRGEHTLIRSFWINLVALRLVILVAERLTHPPVADKSPVAFAAAIIFAFVFHGVVYAWQIVGVIRAGDVYQRGYGSPVIVLGMQAGIVLSVLASLFSAYTAVQAHVDDPSHHEPRVIRPDPLSMARLDVSPDGMRLHLSGDFASGITAKLDTALRSHPAVTAIVLDSNGGNVFEGRGVARLILERNLDTYVVARCFSACTTAYAAGRRRFLGAAGKLGFHQFGLSDAHSFPRVDPDAEQEKDRAFLAGRGIDAAFLSKIFQAPQAGLWVPEPAELKAAGVVHEFLDRDRLPKEDR